MNTIRDMHIEMQNLQIEREDLISLINDNRTTDREYDKAVIVCKEIDARLDDLEHEIKVQNNISDGYYRNNNDGIIKGNRAGPDLFRSSRNSNSFISDGLRPKNRKRKPARTRYNEGREIDNGLDDEFVDSTSTHKKIHPKTYKRSIPEKRPDVKNIPFGLKSIMPYILTKGVTTKIEVIEGFKEYVLYGVAKNTDISLLCEKFEDDGKTPILDRLVSYSPSSEINSYGIMKSVIYKSKKQTDTKIDKTLLEILSSKSTVSVTCGMSKDINFYINSYVCNLLNDMMMLNDINLIFSDTDEFSTLSEKLPDVKNIIINEVKETVKDIRVVAGDGNITISTNKPTLFGFKYIVAEFKNLNVESAQVSIDSNPAIFNTLLKLTKETGYNVFDLYSHEGERFIIVVSELSSKAVIRKNSHAF